MNATPMIFSQKWDDTFSVEAEQRHINRAFYYDIATVAVVVGAVAIVVGAVALSVFSGFVLSPEGAYAVGSIAVTIVYIPAFALAKRFLNHSRHQYHLAEQASTVRGIFNRLKTENREIVSPEGKALTEYWETFATKSSESFNEIKDLDCHTLAERTVQLESERDAAITKVEHIFWKTLSENNEKFEEVFLSHGTNAYGAISQLGTWDKRSVEARFIDLSKSPRPKDVLLTFNDQAIEELFYANVLNPGSNILIERCFNRALFPEAV